MRIESVEMVNWKCFDHKKVDFTNQYTLLNWKNGEGKTTLIQAIVLCLFDKRPDNLDFASLVDVTKPTKITLTFTHNAAMYIIEREVGKTSAYRLFVNGELVGRTNKECKEILNKIIPDSILLSLWGYESLSISNVLNSSYLFEILQDAFAESLAVRQYFVSDKTYNQKHKSTLEKSIKNQKLTPAEVEEKKNRLVELEKKIKSKVCVPDNEVAKAKKAKEDFAEYQRLLKELPASVKLDRELCVRLRSYGSNRTEYENFFKQKHIELDNEKNKATASPLTKYPKNVIASLIHESKCNNDTCILCGGKFKEPVIDYNTVDNDKIMRLEKILEDEQYDFDTLAESIRYWHIKKQIEAVEYSKDIDFDTILSNYNKETNDLYAEYDSLKDLVSELDQELSKINDLLAATECYNKDKECIDILDEYIEQAKQYYAQKIVQQATELLVEMNPRYTKIFVENGIYKVQLFDKDYTTEKILPVQSLSKGEKTIVALSLILSIRDLFFPAIPLVMDESFSNLDANNILAINKIIHRDSNQWIIVSHDERLL